MKKSKIIAYFRFLSGIKVSKITDKEVRAAIISNHLQMYRVAQEHDEDVKEIQKKLFEGKDEKINALNDLRTKYQNEKDEAKKAEIVKIIVDNHAEILELEKELQNAVGEKLKEEKELNLKKVAQDAFIDACVEAEVDITPADLVELDGLFKDEDKEDNTKK